MNSAHSNLNRFKPYLEKIDRELAKMIRTPITGLDDVYRYALLGEGKKLRPLLFVLAAQLCNYAKEDIYRLSILFELVHTGSLLHDDVLDNAEVRRKKPAVRNVWGNPAAVLGGDYFYALATGIAAESQNWSFLAKLNQASSHMVEGQFLELAQTDNWQVDKEQYFEIIRLKTAELIAAACACGALMAEAPESEVDHLNRFGLHFGIGFQMMDDLLDYISSEEVFGKPVGNDLKEGKVTLPLIYALEEVGRVEAEKIGNLLKNRESNPENYAPIMQTVKTHGSIARIKAEIRDYFYRARDFLEPFRACPAKEDLLALTHEMIHRNY